jgi:hypothetical protein
VTRATRVAVLLLLTLTTGLVADTGDPPLIDAVRRGDRATVRAGTPLHGHELVVGQVLSQTVTSVGMPPIGSTV